jgi:prephenate dehydratase/chorismate mutase/prephenate dehydratase
MDKEKIRSAIDAIDYEVVKLLSRRMEHALRLKRLKKDVFEPEREREVIERVRSFSHHAASPDFMERLYGMIIDESRRVQGEDLRLVGFQGEHGAYSEVAALRYDQGLVPIPCESFHEVFSLVEAGQLDCGIVPVENSLEGAVTEVSDLLIETKLRVAGEVSIPVHHCLLALPEQDYRDLRTVYSHPQALAQCRESLGRHRLEARPFYDTAGAALMLREQRPAAAAVIASRLCAELYHLEVLNENMEDSDSNATRFLVISKTAGAEGGDKCSVVLSVAHRPGGLFSVLKVLSDADMNMTRIESRPLRKDPGRYAFFVDFEGSDGDERIKAALEGMKKRSTSFTFLGCYKGDRT